MIADRIRQARLAAGLTLGALGEQVGVSHTAIQKSPACRHALVGAQTAQNAPALPADAVVPAVADHSKAYRDYSPSFHSPGL